MGRKAFGPTKKQACDVHHCKKKKKIVLSNKGKNIKSHLIDTRGI